MTMEDFDDPKIGLKENLLRGIYGYGFSEPTEIQRKAITEIVSGRDLIAQAQSGMGKTGAFSISVLNKIDETNLDTCQALIISPTRELTEQTYEVISSLNVFLKYKIHMSTGGYPLSDEISKLKQGVTIVVGTPGRVLQMLEKHYLKLNSLKIFVLDEADEMLKSSFREQLISILRYIPVEAQVAIFSATMTKEAIGVSKEFLTNPKEILVDKEKLTLDKIKQYFHFVSSEDKKFDTLIDLYSKLCVSQAIIFCNSKKKVNILTEQLKNRGFTVSSIHADMDMKTRNEVSKKFRKGETRILITTDIYARGIDVQAVSFIINYDIPKNPESYLHRIGRSGRYGREGIAVNFITEDDIRDLKTIEQYYKTRINEMPVNINNIF
jgi:superfamily II DNA/RNA helicase